MKLLLSPTIHHTFCYLSALLWETGQKQKSRFFSALILKLIYKIEMCVSEFIHPTGEKQRKFPSSEKEMCSKIQHSNSDTPPSIESTVEKLCIPYTAF